MFSSNDTPAEDYVLAEKLGAIINLDDFTHIDFLEKTIGYILRRSAAATIRADYLRSAMILWTIREMPSTE